MLCHTIVFFNHVFVKGGVLVGASVAEQRVIIVDDVITAGTAIREAVEILHSAKAKICAVTVCLDRQEKTSETSAESAIQVQYTSS